MRLLVVLLAASLCAACSSGTTTAVTTPSRSPHVTASASPSSIDLCFTDPPSDWALAMSSLVASLDGVNFGAGAVDEKDRLVLGGVFGSSRTYIASVDLSTGKLSEISPVQLQGFGWMSFADGWLAWPQFGVGGTSIQLWNAGTHERRQIPTSGPSEAVIGDGDVAWIEATGDTTRALHVYQLASGKTFSLDSGELGGPAVAGGDLVWAKVEQGAQQPSFVFADATSLAPVNTPPELRDVRGAWDFAGSQDTLVWTSSVGDPRWYVDTLAAGVVHVYGVHGHHPQFPQPAGPYLAWFDTGGDAIVDLRSGDGFYLPVPGGVAAAGDTIVVVRGSTLKGRDRSDISVLHPSQLSPLGPCTP